MLYEYTKFPSPNSNGLLVTTNKPLYRYIALLPSKRKINFIREVLFFRRFITTLKLRILHLCAGVTLASLPPHNFARQSC